MWLRGGGFHMPSKFIIEGLCWTFFVKPLMSYNCRVYSNLAPTYLCELGTEVIVYSLRPFLNPLYISV